MVGTSELLRGRRERITVWKHQIDLSEKNARALGTMWGIHYILAVWLMHVGAGCVWVVSVGIARMYLRLSRLPRRSGSCCKMLRMVVSDFTTVYHRKSGVPQFLRIFD